MFVTPGCEKFGRVSSYQRPGVAVPKRNVALHLAARNIPAISSCSGRCWRLLFHHARIFQHVRPFPACSGMAMLKMLPEMIRPVEFLGAIALPEFVMVL